MKISPPLSTPAALTLAARTASGSGWQTGQSLPVTVVDISKSGKVLLRIGGELHTTDSKLPLIKGQSFSAQVAATGRTPLLQIAAGTETAEQVIANTLRQLLPRQQPVDQSLATMLRAINQPETGHRLPSALQTLIRQLIAQLPARQSLTTAGAVKQAMQDTGTLLENKLATGSDPGKTQTDFKAQLLRLLAALEQYFPKEMATRAATPQTPSAPSSTAQKPATDTRTPPPGNESNAPSPRSGTTREGTARPESLLQALNLIKQSLEALLASTTLNQLQSLRPAERHEPLPTLVFDLPIRNADDKLDNFRFRIGREPAPGGEPGQENGWTLTLEFDLNELGPVTARVRVLPEIVSTWFWAEREHTVDLFNEHMGWLRDDLGHSGMNIETHPCRLGVAPGDRPIDAGPIVDTQA